MAEVPFYSDINMQGNRTRNAAASAVGTDYVIRDELDAAVNGLDWKNSARLASVANINLAAPGSALDGIGFNPGDSFLAKNQTLPAENGLYNFNGAASPATRRADADVNAEVTSGLAVHVSEGNTNANTSWVLTTDDPIIVGTTALTFSPFAGGAATFAANIGDGASLAYPVVHNLGTRDVDVIVYDNSTFAKIQTQIVHTSTTTVTVSFNVAPASNAFRVVVIG